MAKRQTTTFWVHSLFKGESLRLIRIELPLLVVVMMAALLSPLSSLSSPPLSSFVVFFPSLSHSLLVNCSSLQSRPSYGVQIHASMPRKAAVIVRAANIDGEPAPEGEAAESKPTEASVPIESLPLESKLQMIQEQRLKMKLAKKIRLRRKRLVRKRHLRKKGRWPPSKMKKLKNV